MAANVDYQTLLSESVLEMRRLRREVDRLEATQNEAIAVVGLGCRFPGGANSPDALWKLLQAGVDTLGEIPASRWDVEAYYDATPGVAGKIYVRTGNFIDEIDQFDAQFFGIAAPEAASLDPQQRLLLEVSWEALEQANIVPADLRASQTGVFIGLFWDDYSPQRFYADPAHLDGYRLLSGLRGLAAGRIAYCLGLHGPTMQLDTACSSSLLAAHLACQSLRQRECDMALVGGVNLILSPEVSISLCAMNALAADGRCKTFDAQADGFGRGEGCGVVVLKRLSDALADNNQILALIRASAVNHDGQSNGLTAPSGVSQANLIRQALQKAKLRPEQISYIEAHGTGTSLGDPIEVSALAEVLGPERTQPLILGSVKTNLGHLEAAAGIASLIKVVLALHHQEIPPHLHFVKPNPHIPWPKMPITIPTSPMPWPSGAAIAGINSFGMSGTNVHMIVEAAPSQISEAEAEAGQGLPWPASMQALPLQSAQASSGRPLHLLTLSAKSQAALPDLAGKLMNHLASQNEAALPDICFTANCARSHFAQRQTIIARDKRDLLAQLSSLAQERPPMQCIGKTIKPSPSPQGQRPGEPKIAFLFTGQGSQYAKMGHQLYQTQPTFRHEIDRCAQLLEPYLERPLRSILFSSSTDKLNQTAYTQPALFALEYALTKLWASWGIQPSAMIGHSLGELVAACLAGVFSLEDGLKLVAARGRLMQALPQIGMMAAVRTDETQVQNAIGRDKDQVSIAAINGPENVVISGKKREVEAILDRLQQLGVKTHPLAVSHAFHSPLMEPMLADFQAVANEINFSNPRVSFITNLTGQLAQHEVTQPDYWVQHVRQPVRFAEGLTTLQQQACDIWLEIGPQPTLLGMVALLDPNNKPIKAASSALIGLRPPLMLSSLRENEEDWSQLLSSLSALYQQGVVIDWIGFDRDYSRQMVSLPTYPFQRTRYWTEKNITSPPTSRGTRTASSLLLNQGVSNQGLSPQAKDSLLCLLEQGQIDRVAQACASQGQLRPDEVEILPKLLDLLYKQHQQTTSNITSTEAVVDWLYHIEWQAKERKRSKTGVQAGVWVILAEGQDQSNNDHQPALVGLRLAEALSSQGHRYVLIHPDEAQPFDQSLQTIADPLIGIIDLRSLRARPTAQLSSDTVLQSLMDPCRDLVSLLQSLDRQQRKPGKIWLITQGVHLIEPAETTSSLASVAMAQVAAWGLGQVIALERPEAWGGLIDLDQEIGTQDIVALAAEIIESDGEDRVAYRSGKRFVARLTRLSHKSQEAHPQITEPIKVRSNAAYLITGGLGALGLHTAQWLVERGAKHLLLMGRRGIRSAEGQEKVAPMQCISNLIRQGAKVQVIQADVANLSRMSHIFDRLDPALPLRGIIHTAGIAGTHQPLSDLSEAALEKILRPKVMGAWLLHHLSQDIALDFFIAFSSISSVWGWGGQGAYATANYFLDLLAHHRQALGLPALTINWGPWAGEGMVQAQTDQRHSFEAMGLKPMEPAQALKALDHLLSWGRPQATVSHMDWSLFQEIYQVKKQHPFLSQVLPQAEPEQVDEVTSLDETLSLGQQLHQSSVRQREQLLMTYLQTEVSGILGFDQAPDLTEGFFNMGMDSLMAVALKRRIEADLGFSLSSTVVFKYPDIQSLAQHLAETKFLDR